MAAGDIQKDDQTPLMKQFWELKAQADGAMLLFRMGDFYELFGDDAVEAARILEITLTSRDKNKPNPVPMAGVPHHSVQGYIQRLLKAGKKIAIGDQIEDPATAKGIVKRAVTRVFTPGVRFDLEGLEGTEANYLAALAAVESVSAKAAPRWILACVDASTGEALLSEPLDEESLSTELSARPIRHLIGLGTTLASSALKPVLEQVRATLLVEELPPNYLAVVQARELLKAQYGIEELSAFIPSDSAALALGLALHYALKTQRTDKLAHLRLPMPLHQPRTLALGPRTAQHLDLIPSAEGGPNLYQTINRTRSALGARALKRWLLAPLKTPGEIAARQTSVRELAEAAQKASGHNVSRLSSELANLYDLERICGRVNANLANPRDTLALGKSLTALHGVTDLIQESRSPLLQGMRLELAQLDEKLSPLAQKITTIQKDDAPLLARDGGIFNKGTTPELDRLLSLTEDGQRWLVDLEAREREAAQIPSLKVRYNRVFGYYIEVTQAHLKNVPAHYQRKQTTVGAERFFTEELKKFEDEIVHASARQKALELELFESLVDEVRAQTTLVMDAARLLGEFDALLSLSLLAQEPGWCFPTVDESLRLEIKDGRHPLVDGTRDTFVPNDIDLSPETRLTLMITGPNMGGKSTVMRQTALIVILGQMGSPVPASQASWGAVSSLYTRIGAHDAIARGQSTFMVEMSELAHILHHADARSLILLDEIGRGTSTYDGMSVAYATLEWICAHIQARTLFATHYHELTRLVTEFPLLANAHMAVDSGQGGKQGTLRFLYKLKDGPANESFGIHVAKIAGLPKQVISRAWTVLENLEKSGAHLVSAEDHSAQLSLFSLPSTQATHAAETAPEVEPVPPHPALLALDEIKIEEMTPIQALNFVVKLQEMAKETARAPV